MTLRTYSLDHIAHGGVRGVCPDCLQARIHLSNCPNAPELPENDDDQHQVTEDTSCDTSP